MGGNSSKLLVDSAYDLVPDHSCPRDFMIDSRDGLEVYEVDTSARDYALSTLEGNDPLYACVASLAPSVKIKDSIRATLETATDVEYIRVPCTKEGLKSAMSQGLVVITSMCSHVVDANADNCTLLPCHLVGYNTDRVTVDVFVDTPQRTRVKWNLIGHFNQAWVVRDVPNCS